MSKLFNLEPFCADYGMRLIDGVSFDEYENVINKALGILVENGLYAMSVFLLSCNKPVYGKHVLETLLAMCADKNMPKPLLQNMKSDAPDVLLHAVRTLTQSLDTLILARKMMEQALTFGRYHCKALKKSGG